jgi:hypothetical protein
MRLKTWAALAAAALTLPLLGGCGNDNANDGYVRNINATTEYTSLDLYTVSSDGSTDSVISGTAASTASSYSGIDKGTYSFEVKSSTSTGTPTPVSGTITKSDHFALITYLTGSTTKTQFLSEEEGSPASGNAKLRIFNAASSEAASVDVYLTSNDCGSLSVTDSPFASAVTDLQASYTQITAASAGTSWNVCVFAAGDTGTLLLDIPSLTLKNQEIATLVLTHTAGGVLLNGAVLQQQGAYTAYSSGLARVRVVADAASGGKVTVSVGSSDLATAAPSPSVGDYITVATGSFAPTIAYDGVSATGFTLPDLTAGNDYTLMVTGTVGAPAATLITDNNTPSTNSTNTVKVRVVNGVNGGSGTVAATVDGKSVGSASFGAASTSYTNIAPTSGTSDISAIMSGTAPADLIDKSFIASSVYTIFIYGDATAPKMVQSVDR